VAGATFVYDTQVSGGQLTVLPGAEVNSATIAAGGVALVQSGGIAYDPVLGNGGTLWLSAGGELTGALTFAGAGATLAIGGTVLPSVAIGGFAAADAFDLRDIASGSGATATLNSATDVLTVSAGGISRTLHLAGTYAGSGFDVIGDGGSGSLVEIACFAGGTHIATPSGAVAVEDLAVGDAVWTQTGRAAPVRWVGRRVVDAHRHPTPEKIWPVLVAAGAFGAGLPARDLWLSPDHAVFCDGVLIPVRCLIDGASIAQVPMNRIEYFHVELDRHDILAAEGLPVESFLDTGQRAAFAGGVTALFPDFACRQWDGAACAELVVAGPLVAAVRRRLRYFGETGTATSLRRSGGSVQGGS